MTERIEKLILKRPKRGFLANELRLTCDLCGHKEKSTYYDLIKERHYEILEPTTVPVTFIREYYHEEDEIATPLKFSKKCPNCGGQMEIISPVPLEYIMGILQMPPPDDIMYG